MELEGAKLEKNLAEEHIRQSEATMAALRAQVDQLKHAQESLELQLATCVTQQSFLAMENQYKSKQAELTRLNQETTQLRQENFSLRAQADNN